MNPLAFVLYAVSFVLMGGCAALVAAWGIRRFVAWRSESEWPGPVTYIEPQSSYVGPHPIYTRMVSEHPDIIPVLDRARRRNLIVRITADTSKFEEGMRRFAAAINDTNETLRRLNKEAAARRRANAVGLQVGRQINQSARKPRRTRP